jgi:hypothetical protein
MSATRHTVVLYKGQSHRRTTKVNIDPRSDEAVRELLDEMVEKDQGSLNVDMSRFWIEVKKPITGMVAVRCTVDGSGRARFRR